MGFYTTLFHSFFSYESVSYEPIFGLNGTFPSSSHQWLYLIPVALIGLAWVFNHSIWKEIFGFLSNTSNPANISSKAKITNFASIFLLANYLLSGNLFFHSLNNNYAILDYVFITTLLIGVPFIIWILSKVIMVLTNQRVIFKLHNIHLYYQICFTGVLLYIAAVLGDLYPEYGGVITLATIVFAVLLNVIRLSVSAIRGFQLQFSLFYIILYLCTLEILPFIATYAVLS